MNTAISFSLPWGWKRALQRQVDAGFYNSISEAVRAGVGNVIHVSNDDESWVTDDLVARVKEAEKEPLESSHEWDGKGPFGDFVLKSRS